MNILAGVGRERYTGKCPSSHNEAKIKSKLKPNQRIIPIGVIIILSLFLVVAILYINSAYLLVKLIGFPFQCFLVKCSLARVRRQGESLCFLDRLDKTTINFLDSADISLNLDRHR